MSVIIDDVKKLSCCTVLMLKVLMQKLRLGQKNISHKISGRLLVLSVSVICVSACNAGPEMVSAPITGYNHTAAEIIRFSINGAGGPSIPANQGGGEVCCGVLPVQWAPGIRAIIEWDKDPNPYEKLKRDQYGQIVKESAVRHSAGYSHHTATVEIPKYAEKVCALQVHFLPCDKVKVSTTCFTPGNPNYPDKAYFQVKEPASCSNH
ncbi:DUF3304 domain-containing protein [Pseudomonas sp. fls2-241-R2A-110]|uniref:DUF3304 domain-containing protein n=1 Tax=Pseudomonas sp. fls2-241-R2A-110 TaxID=3040311 RepID=UPI0025559781|nr:DUF3304 domain-containing protein [Pseudomonas sp. fls2-241-R2A-110]